jgi:tRNA A37 threonylcarbamoyladenosine modification protein TsaB
MILFIDTTDNDLAVLVVTDGKKHIRKEFTSLPHAEDFAIVLKKFLAENKMKFLDVEKIAVKVGPGFFSRVRTAVVAANALAYGLGIKVIPVKGEVDFAKLAKQSGQGMVVPMYGAKPHITKAKSR